MNTAQAILGVALVVLVYADVAQTTLTVNGGGRPSAAVVRSARSAVDSFIAAMPARADTPGMDAPAAPELDGLRRLGIPTASEAEFKAVLNGLKARRHLLQALSRNEGWA